MAASIQSPSVAQSPQDHDSPSSQSSLGSCSLGLKRGDNSLLSFGTPTASSRLAFDALRQELQTDSSASSAESDHASPQVQHDTGNDEPLKPEDLMVSAAAPGNVPQPAPEQLSPTRKAIADKFDKLSMGPPQHTSTSGRPPSPFKRALMNSHRSNVQQRGESSPSRASRSGSPKPFKSTGPSPHDTSIAPDMSLSFNHHAANSSLEFDLLGAPDDSLLVEAKRMGDESFDKRIIDRSPRKASASPRKQKPAAPAPPPAVTPLKALLASRQDRSTTTALSSPLAARPEPGNALGLGIGEPSSTASRKDGQQQHDSSPINLDMSSQRSFCGDVSDLFDEQGEQSLLYPSTRLKVKPGAAGGARQRFLAALAEVGEDEQASRPSKSPTKSQTSEASARPRTREAQPISAEPSEDAVTSKALKRRSVPVVRPSSTRATTAVGTPSKHTSTETRTGSPNVKARTAAGLSRSTSLRSRPSMTPKAPTLATPRLRTVETPKTAQPEEATPRSRPPLNASAARMRRLSALPQLVDEAGNMKPPPSSYKPGAGAGNAPPIPAKKERPRSMIGRPSLAPAAPTDASQSSPRGKRSSAAPASIQSSRPRPHSFIGVSRTATVRDSSAEKDPEQFSGQLPRKSPTVTPPNLPTALPGSGSGSGKKPPRPFLLGSGTNHAASPTETPRLGASPRKSALPAPALPPKSRARPTSLIMPREVNRGTTSTSTSTTPASSESRPRASIATGTGIAKSSSSGSIAGSGASRLPRQSIAAPSSVASGAALARRSSARSTNAPSSYRGPMGLGSGAAPSATSGTSDSARPSSTTTPGSSRVSGIPSSGSASRIARPRPSTAAADSANDGVAAGSSTPRARSAGATAAARLGLSRASSLKSSLGRAGQDAEPSSTMSLSRSTSSSGARRTHRRTESQHSTMSTASSSSSVSTIRG